MKVTEATQVNANRHRLEDAMKLIQEVYVEPETGFDDYCVASYKVIMCREKLVKVIAVYDKVKVIPKGSLPLHWPIQPYEEEFGYEASVQIIQKLAQKKE
jgi:hypothetical protein